MTKEKKTQETVTLEIKSLLNFVDELEISCDTGKHQYSTRTMLKLYLYMLIKRISGFKTIAKQLKLKPELLSLLGLGCCPHRTTIAKQADMLRQQIRSLHSDFVAKDVTLVDAMSADSSLMHAKANVWHKKQRDKGELPSCGNIDTEAY